jgi:hypothetical protein
LFGRRTGRGQEDPLVVQGRVKGDIEALFPKADVRLSPARDYRFRALVARKVVAEVLAKKAMDIDYDNFKDSITDKARFWWELMNLQRGRAGTTKAQPTVPAGGSSPASAIR